MLPDAQVLTILSNFANYKPRVWPSTTKSLAASDFCLLQVSITPPQEESTGFMAHNQRRSSRAHHENELWFSLPNSSRRQQEQSRPSEQSAYRATSNRTSVCSTNTRTSPQNIPTISTSTHLNKPLPPSPSESEKRKRKSTPLRGLLRRDSSTLLNPSHLQPEPYAQRYSNLSVDTNSHQYHNYSRSMPSSPFEHSQASTSPDPASIPRASSAAGNYFEQTQYQPYTPPQHLQTQALPVRQQRAISMNTYFESTTPPRARTFPESATLSPSSTTARENMSNRPRPHTWLSPTEPFTDVSQFHLFAEAMTGLPNDSDPFSPNGPPQLQGSLFARRTQNDTIPLPLHYSAPQPSQSSQRTEGYSFAPPSFGSRSVSAPISSLPQNEPYQQWQPPPHMAAVNMELEMLGLDDDHAPDDELPDYAQSQAEMNARRREEASARARELEARWRGARGR